MRVARIEFAAYLQSSALAVSITMIGAPVRVNGAYSSFITLGRPLVVGADDHAVRLHEVLDRRALLQELGVADDAERLRRFGGDRRRAPCAAVPTGTVLLSTTTVYLFIARPMSRATAEHVLQIGRAVLALRRADGDEDDLGGADGRGQVGREASAAPRRGCAGPSPRDPARRSASRPASSVAIFAASLSTQMTSLPFSARQAPSDEPDVPGSHDGDFHFTIRY